jgi:hypothetical protein
LLELLSGVHENPVDTTKEICRDFRYDAWVYNEAKKLPAVAEIEKLKSNTSWGSHIATRNVLFTPA